MPDTTIPEDRPRSPWTPSYSVITQGSTASDEQANSLHQEKFDRRLSEQYDDDRTAALMPLIGVDPDEMSVSTNAPEAPDTPRSELGIFTPDFDTRSEVSAASREPASPTPSPDIVAEQETPRRSTPEQKIESICEVIGGHQVPEVFPSSSNILAGEPQTIHKKSVNSSPSLITRVLIFAHTDPRSCT
ncbi:hypothetical protein PILCRDRAFT_378559 [Piloderma croceum F 1598]|uniref:Uncharacterized protein n=1 Tax=Piloderma croceum (strain F 1598) TaxID=765440 RepID=A0A0C3BFF0_PILCF|nr:hypothetical protein PILCRDRAFT_378559 [Piloderma croceum F 1598]